MPYVPERFLRPSQMAAKDKEGQPVPVVPPAEKAGGIPLRTDATSETPDQIQPVSPLTQAVPAARQETGQPAVGQAGAEVTAGQPGAEAAGAGGGHEQPKTPEPLKSGEQPKNTELGEIYDDPGFKTAMKRYAEFILSGTDRRWNHENHEGDDAKEIQRLEKEADLEEAVRGYNQKPEVLLGAKKAVSIWEVIRPQKEKEGYVDPWDRLWQLHDKGQQILSEQIGVHSLSLDVIKQKQQEIAGFLNKKIEGLPADKREELVAVRAAYGLEMVMYYLANPRHEEGTFNIREKITEAKQALDSINQQTNGRGLLKDEILVRNWLQALQGLAGFFDYAVKPIEDSSTKSLQRFQGAADRFLVSDSVLKSLFESKKVSEAEHRAGMKFKRERRDESGKKIRESQDIGGLDRRPDYLLLGSTDPRDDLLRIVGDYLNIATVKCNKTVKTTSTFLYPIYESLQTGLQRLYERGYGRMYGNAYVLIDTPDIERDFIWGAHQETSVYFYQGTVTRPDGPAQGWLKAEMKFNQDKREWEIDDSKLPANISRDSLLKVPVSMPVPIEAKRGDLLYGTLWNYHLYADETNVGRFFEYKNPKSEVWARQNDDKEEFSTKYKVKAIDKDGKATETEMSTVKGYVVESFESLDRAIAEANKEKPGTEKWVKPLVKDGETFIGEKNLAWLLGRRGATKAMWDAIDPRLKGMDFERYIANPNYGERVRELNSFWQRVLDAVNDPQLIPQERKVKYSMLQKIIGNNMAWGRTVWVQKDAFSYNKFTEGISAQAIPILQAGVDIDEVYLAQALDKKGERLFDAQNNPVYILKRSFDGDMLGRVAAGGGSELQTVAQYIRYYVEDESPMLKSLAGNFEPLNYGKLMESAMNIHEKGMFKSERMVPEASDYIIRQMMQGFLERYIVGQAEMIRRQGQKFAFMDTIYPFRHHIEVEENKELHFTAARLEGDYERERGQEMVKVEGSFMRRKKAEWKKLFGQDFPNPRQEREFEHELLARNLLRRGMNENSHVDAWNFFARKNISDYFEKLTMIADSKTEKPLFTKKEVDQLFGQEDNDGLRPLQILLTGLGLTANLTEGKTDIQTVDNFLRVGPSNEIQRKDRYLKEYREITEQERYQRFLSLCGNNKELADRVNYAFRSYLGNKILQQYRVEGQYQVSNLLLSYDFLDIVHWVHRDLILPYLYEKEFSWSENRSYKANLEAHKKMMADEVQQPDNSWVWTKGRDYYWINQGESSTEKGIDALNSHVLRWATGSVVGGQIIPFGQYKGQFLYDPYHTQELNPKNGTRRADYNTRLTQNVPEIDPTTGDVAMQNGQPLMRQEKENVYGVSRARSLCLGHSTRELDSDWTESFPINNPEMALIYFMGYFHVHKQQIVCAELADKEYASRKYKGTKQVEQVTKTDREGREYRSIFLEHAKYWLMATVGPDNAEGILADMSQLAHNPEMNYDPRPFREYARKLGISRDDPEMVSRVRGYRTRLFDIGLRDAINPPRTLEGENILKHALQASDASGKQVMNILDATGEIIGSKGIAELIQLFPGINLSAELGGGKKYRTQGTLKTIGAGLFAPPFVATLLGMGFNLSVPLSIAPCLALAALSAVATPDVSGDDINIYTNYAPINILGPKLIYRLQDQLALPIYESKLWPPKITSLLWPLKPIVSHNRRFQRIKGYAGTEGNAKGKEFYHVGPYPSIIGADFMKKYLMVVLKYLRGAAHK